MPALIKSLQLSGGTFHFTSKIRRFYVTTYKHYVDDRAFFIEKAVFFAKLLNFGRDCAIL